MSAALATVAEEEELRDGGPAVGRLPLVTDLNIADVPRQTAAALTNLFEYGTHHHPMTHVMPSRHDVQLQQVLSMQRCCAVNGLRFLIRQGCLASWPLKNIVISSGVLFHNTCHCTSEHHPQLHFRSCDVCAGSTLLSQGLSAVTEAPPPAECSAVAAPAVAPGSPVTIASELGLAASGPQSPPAAISTSPSSVDAAAAAWRGRAFNAAFQGSPTMFGCATGSVCTTLTTACQRGYVLGLHHEVNSYRRGRVQGWVGFGVVATSAGLKEASSLSTRSRPARLWLL